MRLVSSGGGGTHWYEPVEQLTPILKTPDGVPPGWGVTVENNVPVLRRGETPPLLVEADRLVSQAHNIVWASYPEWEGENGRRDPLNKVLWHLHALLRSPSDPLEDTQAMRETGS